MQTQKPMIVKFDIKTPQDRREIIAILGVNFYKAYLEEVSDPKWAGQCRVCVELNPTKAGITNKEGEIYEAR